MSTKKMGLLTSCLCLLCLGLPTDAWSKGASFGEVPSWDARVHKSAAPSCPDQTTSREYCNNNIRFLCKCEEAGQEPTYEPRDGGCDEDQGCRSIATTAMGIAELCTAVEQLTPDPAGCHDDCTDQGVQPNQQASDSCCKVEKVRACSAKPESCGDGSCDEPCEDCGNCEEDCGPCEPDDCMPGDPACETCNSDGLCDAGEDCATCPSDCPSCETCGDSVCDASEDCMTCDIDCGPCSYCGDGTCGDGEDCMACDLDCGPCETCGDAVCDASEDCMTCDLDCGPCQYCGDGTCDGGEDCSTCDIDCGLCSYCGDAVCDASEDCMTCDLDCGSCP